MKNPVALRLDATGISRGIRVARRFTGIVLALASLTPLSFPACADDYMSPGMTPFELQQRQESGNAPMVVDLSAPITFKIAHLPGAINIPAAELEKRLDEVMGDSDILIYCVNGVRTRQPALPAHSP
ncbi:MAG: rhodanese-like domain-containing protein [Gammaproteobacteria bacterium]|jgi:hypothetical protein